MEIIKILEAKAANYTLFLSFSDGTSGSFKFNDFFEFKGQLKNLNDPNIFNQVKISEYGNHIFWTDEIDLDTEVLYSIISKKPIKINGKVVFDPLLGKKAWL